jgi:AcrR family transcriptional regulator
MGYSTHYCSVQNGLSNSEIWYRERMSSEGQGRPRLTAKGERTRTRIVEAAARLIYERGVAGTTLDDVKAAADVSGSQMYHYFPDKDELVQAVIAHQADVIADNQRQADLGSAEGLRAWRDMVIAQVEGSEGKGGCPLGSLAGQLAETDSRARALIAAGFGQWQAAIGDGLRRLHDAGNIPDGTDPDALAVTLLATLQGGLLLAQVQRDARPLETAVGTLLELVCSSRPDVPTGAETPGSQILTGK